MKNGILFITVLLFVFQIKSVAQNFEILGTIHSGNNYINADSIYNQLIKFKPEVIFVEFDSTLVPNCNFVDSAANKTNINNFEEKVVELQAIIKYKIKFPNVCLLPYDKYIANRDDFIDNFQNQLGKVFEKVTQLANKRKLSKLVIAKIDAYTKAHDSLRVYAKGTLQQLNSEKALMFSAASDSLLHQMLLQLAQNKKFKKDRNWMYAFIDFENSRNQIMCEKVNIYLAKNKHVKTMLVCGLSHKYYLENCLK